MKGLKNIYTTETTKKYDDKEGKINFHKIERNRAMGEKWEFLCWKRIFAYLIKEIYHDCMDLFIIMIFKEWIYVFLLTEDH